jgi:hypothetical protein
MLKKTKNENVAVFYAVPAGVLVAAAVDIHRAIITII